VTSCLGAGLNVRGQVGAMADAQVRLKRLMRQAHHPLNLLPHPLDAVLFHEAIVRLVPSSFKWVIIDVCRIVAMSLVNTRSIRAVENVIFVIDVIGLSELQNEEHGRS
jgi:hypothetical protein